ncbi:hypothetical protein COCON_G00024130 [Conger conger]|uniref:Uncharacterized protein n=1 Tax=Conger conger TaxID=82655 RepID=A0A9Q1DXH6_CONCO|nr:hypothetical protein COCON_G00024130 [Conger conger]
MDEDTLCPVCEDVACDSVPLSCGHRPCKNCLTQHWKQRNDQVCPLCWKMISGVPLPNVTIKKRSLPRDRVPANQICDQHSYPLSWYCLKDEELVCRTCELGSKHNGHEFCPVEQAAQERKSFFEDPAPQQPGEVHLRSQNSQGFTSGRHQWGVEVEDNSNWAVGVAKQSVLRKARTIQGQEVVRTAGISALQFRNGRYATEMGPVSVQMQQAAPVLKKIVGDSRGTLTKKLEGHEEARLTLNTMSRHVKSQAQQTEREIKDEFEKLHRFLREEEEARIAALKEEEEQKSQMMKQRIEKITMEMSFISNTISTIEKELQAEDISFLQGYSQTIKRIWQSLQDPQSSGMFSSGVTQLINRMKTSFSTPGQIHNDTLTRIYGTPLKPEPITNGLIDVAKHLGNLKYRVWEKMLGTLQYTPVTLDPNTATP